MITSSYSYIVYTMIVHSDTKTSKRLYNKMGNSTHNKTERTRKQVPIKFRQIQRFDDPSQSVHRLKAQSRRSTTGDENIGPPEPPPITTGVDGRT